ncbi:MAG: helix-turn-helix domain-containing protein [Patescibacteria group bacterium]|jgi:sugar-specific transcriptional regulator TrmB
MGIYNNLLTKIGLDEKEAEVYEALLSLGKAGMGKLAANVSIKRGSAYNAVYSLKKRGLITELEENRKKVFQIENPEKLNAVISQTEQSLKEANSTLEGSLPSLKSAFNLIMHRPNVRFFEGAAGIQTVADDSLSSKEEIYSYIDNAAVAHYIPDLNKNYIGRREKMGIKKKMIAINSDYIQKNAARYQRPLTELRTIETIGDVNFGTVMQIYDGKVTYLALGDASLIGVIIEDSHIYRMHRLLFEYTWRNASIPTVKPLSSSLHPSASAQS